MKPHTHPTITKTFIQLKDGSSYIKYWFYPRTTLILEGDSKNWESSKNQPSYVWSQLVYSLTKEIEKQDEKSKINISYWDK